METKATENSQCYLKRYRAIDQKSKSNFDTVDPDEWLLGTGRQEEVEVYEEGQGDFQSGGYLHYPDCGDSFMDVHVFKRIKLCTSDACRWLYVSHAAIELVINEFNLRIVRYNISPAPLPIEKRVSYLKNIYTT